MHPARLAVLGLGPLGLSLAWQSRRAGLDVLGFDPAPARAVRALRLGALADRADTLRRALTGADLVAVTGDAAFASETLGRLAPLLEPGAVVSALAPVLAPAVAAASAAGLGDRFAAVHPFVPSDGPAGAERLRGALVYVASEDERPAREVMSFWREALDAHPVRIAAEDHDRQVAWTGQLAGAVARAMAAALADPGLAGASLGPQARALVAAAARDQEEWSAAALGNPANLALAVQALETQLERLRAMLVAGDAEGLRTFGGADRHSGEPVGA